MVEKLGLLEPVGEVIVFIGLLDAEIEIAAPIAEGEGRVGLVLFKAVKEIEVDDRKTAELETVGQGRAGEKAGGERGRCDGAEDCPFHVSALK